MSDHLNLDIVCPNNHNQTFPYTREEFENAVKSDALMFHCNTCDTNWTSDGEQIAKIRKEFARAAA